MNPWNTESETFAHWLGMQASPTILPNQVGVVGDILDRLGNGDLICVMFNCSGEPAMKALNMLKHRYEEERYALDEMNRTQYPEDEDETTDWG
jgi:hypothetical protein